MSDRKSAVLKVISSTAAEHCWDRLEQGGDLTVIVVEDVGWQGFQIDLGGLEAGMAEHGTDGV